MVTLRLFRGRSSWHPECSPLFHHADPQYSLFSRDEDGLLNKAVNMTACSVALWLLSRYATVAIDDNELQLMNLLCSQVSHTKELLRGTKGKNLFFNLYLTLTFWSIGRESSSTGVVVGVTSLALGHLSGGNETLSSSHKWPYRSTVTAAYYKP